MPHPANAVRRAARDALEALFRVLDNRPLAVGLALLLSVFWLSACATRPIEQTLGDVDTYVVCASADIATTAAFLAYTGRPEINPVVNAVTVKGLGHVLGTVVPAIALAVGVYFILREIDNPTVTAVASGLTCAAAARNAVLLM